MFSVFFGNFSLRFLIKLVRNVLSVVMKNRFVLLLVCWSFFLWYKLFVSIFWLSFFRFGRFVRSLFKLFLRVCNVVIVDDIMGGIDVRLIDFFWKNILSFVNVGRIFFIM